ncbi:MAG: hypothetical protein WHV66_03365 [Anaerolineales bacterium]
MNLAQIVDQLHLTLLTEPRNLAELQPSGGYTSDLLSCVMSGAKQKSLWVTLQAHGNIVAVAALLDLCAVIITEGAQPEPATVEKANQEGIILLSTNEPSFAVVGKLWEMGLRAC